MTNVAFTGSKVALFVGEKIATVLRDDKPTIPNPAMWDFFGGAREDGETPLECAAREIEEELGILLPPERFVWSKPFPSVNEPGRFSYFLVAHLMQEEIESAHLTEGQRWEVVSTEEFLAKGDAIPKMKLRLQDYLEVLEKSKGVRNMLIKEDFRHIYEWYDEPGMEYPRHKHLGEVALCILDGGLTLWFEKKTVVLLAGDRFDLPVGEQHTAKVGTDGCTFLVGEMIEGDF